MIYAGLYGLESRLELPASADINLYRADSETLRQFRRLPATQAEARAIAAASDFIRAHLPAAIVESYCGL